MGMSSLAMALMMVAMMLPSFAATLWTYHRQLLASHIALASQRTILFALGYGSVWTVISFVLTTLPASQMVHPAPWMVRTLLLCVGAVQCSDWKARRLARCGRGWVSALDTPSAAMPAWRQGVRFGVDCALSCAGPMAVLCVVGLMDVPMMLIITAAITAERAAPAGVRVARFTGLVALTVGLL